MQHRTWMSTAVHKVLATAGVRGRLEKIGGLVATSTPGAQRERVARAVKMWTAFVDRAGVTKL